MDATKNMGANNALMICCGKKNNRSRKCANQSSMTQTDNARKTSKEEKKTETTRTLIQRIKTMKASKVKKFPETVNSIKGEKFGQTKEPEAQKTNKMDKSLQIEASRSEN